MRRLAMDHEVLVTIEEGTIGGFASQITHFLAFNGLLESGLKFRPMYLPDFYIDHDTQQQQYKIAGLSAEHIVDNVLKALESMGLR